jgi:hypothetical protein
MSRETVTRILMSAMAMIMCTIACVSVGVAAWVFALLLVWMGAIGLLSPEIERAWAKSSLPGSDNYRSNR